MGREHGLQGKGRVVRQGFMQPKAVFMLDSLHDKGLGRTLQVSDRVMNFFNLRTALALSCAACVVIGYMAFTRSNGEAYGIIDVAFILALGVFLLSTIKLLMQLARTSLNSGIRNVGGMPSDRGQVHMRRFEGLRASAGDMHTMHGQTRKNDEREFTGR